MVRKSDKPQLSRSGWVRAMILQKPDITLEQLQKEFDRQADKLGFPKKERPKAMQAIYQGRSQLAKRWGLASIEDIPRLSNGEVNISGMIRLYVDRWPESGEGEARAYFADDGLTLNKGQFTSGKSTYLKNVAKATPAATKVVEEEEPLQGEGPRAGKPGRRKYKRRGKGKRGRQESEGESVKADVYEGMEKAIDDLIAQASDLKHRELVRDLTMARRRASAAVLQHSK